MVDNETYDRLLRLVRGQLDEADSRGLIAYVRGQLSGAERDAYVMELLMAAHERLGVREGREEEADDE